MLNSPLKFADVDSNLKCAYQPRLFLHHLPIGGANKTESSIIRSIITIIMVFEEVYISIKRSSKFWFTLIHGFLSLLCFTNPHVLVGFWGALPKYD